MSAREKKQAMAGNEAMEPLSEIAVKAPEEAAAYIADMLLGLRGLAKDKQMEFLAYLLEMSFQEAFELSQKKKKDGR